MVSVGGCVGVVSAWSAPAARSRARSRSSRPAALVVVSSSVLGRALLLAGDDLQPVAAAAAAAEHEVGAGDDERARSRRPAGRWRSRASAAGRGPSGSGSGGRPARCRTGRAARARAAARPGRRRACGARASSASRRSSRIAVIFCVGRFSDSLTIATMTGVTAAPRMTPPVQKVWMNIGRRDRRDARDGQGRDRQPARGLLASRAHGPEGGRCPGGWWSQDRRRFRASRALQRPCAHGAIALLTALLTLLLLPADAVADPGLVRRRGGLARRGCVPRARPPRRRRRGVRGVVDAPRAQAAGRARRRRRDGRRALARHAQLVQQPRRDGPRALPRRLQPAADPRRPAAPRCAQRSSSTSTSWLGAPGRLPRAGPTTRAARPSGPLGEVLAPVAAWLREHPDATSCCSTSRTIWTPRPAMPRAPRPSARAARLRCSTRRPPAAAAPTCRDALTRDDVRAAGAQVAHRQRLRRRAPNGRGRAQLGPPPRVPPASASATAPTAGRTSRAPTTTRGSSATSRTAPG